MKNLIAKKRILLFLINVFCLFSCVSNENKKVVDLEENNKTLRILIVNEKGHPLSGINVDVHDRQTNYTISAISDSSGVVTIQNVQFGNFIVSSKNVGYTSLDKVKVTFTNEQEVFICSISHADSVFEMVSSLYDEGKYQEGLNLIDKLYLTKSSPFFVTACFHRTVGYTNLGEEKKALDELNKISEVDPLILSEVLGE